jgi:Lrp/AsnC family transcriptional regulator for asnA, asnC and gidA
MERLDESDWKIIRALKKDSRLSNRELAKITKISTATINRRTRRLQDNRVIEGYTILLNNEKIGKEILAYLLIRARPGANYTAMMDEIGKREEVEDICAVAGEFDIILKVRVCSIKDLDHFLFEYLNKVPDVMQTQTLMVFRGRG